MNYEWIVYKTTNLINRNIYIGVHKTEIGVYDGYIGNGIYKPGDARKKYPFHKAVKKYGYKNFKRETLFTYPFTEEGKKLAFKKEAELVNIEFLKRKDVYNVVCGGKVPSSINEKEIAQYDLDGVLLNVYHSIAYAARITGESKSSIQHCCSKLTYCNKYQWRYFDGNINNIESAKTIYKTVYQFDLNGNYITCYKSITDASEITGISISLISAVCTNKHHSAGNYYWSFKKQFNYKLPSNISKRVACYNDNGELISIYESIHNAADSLSISRANISACIKGRYKRCKGLRWRFYDGIDKIPALKD